MRRGDVVTVALAPSAASGEPARRRPAILISNSAHASRAAMSGIGTLVVVPITSNVSRIFPFQLGILEPDAMRAMGLSEPSKAQVEQMTSVAVPRILEIRGRTPSRAVWELDELIKLHLSLT